MKKYITLNPISKINGVVNLPGSKSISNRALLISALANGTTILNNLLDSDDVRYMLQALKILNINYKISSNYKTCKINGIGTSFKKCKPLFLYLGNAGTATRSLIASLSLNKNNVIITGNNRMKERPIQHLVDALRQGGAVINYVEKENYLPLHLTGGYLGGTIIVDGSISSQFLTALLMISPLALKNTHIYIKNKLVSKPYIKITLSLMKKFGITVINDNYQLFKIKGNNTYQSPGSYLIEGDASSASYFLAAAAIKGGTVRVNGIDKYSIQGDIYFAKILQKMGAIINYGSNYIECTRGTLNAIDVDMNDIPDAAMTLAIVALFVNNNNTTVLRNIYNWRVKETDRLSAMTTELRKIGAIVIEGNDYLKITPPVKFNIASIDTYDDHRIAMCFSLLSLSNISITIINPECTNKTFPNFFNVLKTLIVC